MQLMKNRLVAKMLAAGANKKIAPVTIFYKKYLCYSNGLFSPSAFLPFLSAVSPQERLVLFIISSFE